jgi:tetratricopeptide (TPR) repeat protein
MGVVYEAEETGPVRRRVAVKVVRAGLISKDVIGRFEAERQALAVMNHPGIAKVLGAGTTDTGQPYFAMELVRGLPLTTYCDTHRLSIPARLELFIAVCHAVQHAHQKGVSHRDLKPTNVLITEQDGQPQPKIIDFGIAKALGQQLTETTLVTLSGQAMGTAAYMSPEQADPAGLDTDTRADIYSLGVMLYELLVGELPTDPAQLGLHVFLSRLAAGDTHPQAPSTRLTGRNDQASAAAYLRRTAPDHLRRALRGDLDWIVLKAMAPERSRRYETANGLALDLRHHLADEPVLARPPLATYQIAKFVRRHRRGVSALALIILALVVGSVLATLGFLRASRAEQVAAQEAAAAQTVTDFLVSLFRGADPTRSRGATLTAREILDRGAGRASTELASQPVVQARLLHTLGTVYEALGLFDPARAQYEEAFQVRERVLGPRSLPVAETRNALGDVERERGDYEAAEAHFQEALAIRREALGHEHVDVSSSLASLAALRVRQGRVVEAESLYVEIMALDRRVRQPDDARIGRNMRGRAAAVYIQGRYAEAESLYVETLRWQEQALGMDHPDVAGTFLNLGAVYQRMERYAEALPAYERAREIYEQVLDSAHIDLAGVYNNIAEVDWRLRRFVESEELFRRALRMKEQALSPGSPSIANTLNGLAGLLRDQRRFGEAEGYYTRALAIREEALGPADPNLIETLEDFAELLELTGRTVAAEQLRRRVAAANASR